MTQTKTETGIAVGVAGWRYDDWKDTVYRIPPPPPRQPDLFDQNASTAKTRYAEDELAFLAHYVDILEINSSFYAIPPPKRVASWRRRVGNAATDFAFTAKLNQAFTHEFRHNAGLADNFRESLQPLVEKDGPGQLRAVLAQFRYDFEDTLQSRRLLEWIEDQFGDWAPLVLELRHNSWEAADAQSFLQDLQAGVAALDYPTASNSLSTDYPGMGKPAYFRVHGRNRKAWFSREAGVNETYNYEYSPREVHLLSERARQLVEERGELIFVANNHYQGKSLATATRLQAELEQVKVPCPPALLETYPQLAEVAAPETPE